MLTRGLSGNADGHARNLGAALLCYIPVSTSLYNCPLLSPSFYHNEFINISFTEPNVTCIALCDLFGKPELQL